MDANLYWELTKLPKSRLIEMHIDNGGLLRPAEYAKWSKEELVTAVMEDMEA